MDSATSSAGHVVHSSLVALHLTVGGLSDEQVRLLVLEGSALTAARETLARIEHLCEAVGGGGGGGGGGGVASAVGAAGAGVALSLAPPVSNLRLPGVPTGSSSAGGGVSFELSPAATIGSSGSAYRRLSSLGDESHVLLSPGGSNPRPQKSINHLLTEPTPACTAASNGA